LRAMGNRYWLFMQLFIVVKYLLTTQQQPVIVKYK